MEADPIGVARIKSCREADGGQLGPA